MDNKKNRVSGAIDASVPLSQILPSNYYKLLIGLRKTICANVYLYGGWVLSSILNKPYFGDIDIVVDTSLSQIESVFQRSGITYDRNPYGNIRIRLSDGNHIDISPLISSGQKISILEFIASRTFTVNAVAVNVSDGSYVFSQEFVHDLTDSRFDFAECGELGNLRPLSVLRNWHALQDYFGLIFSPKSSEKLNYLRISSSAWPVTDETDIENPLPALKKIVSNYLPPFSNVRIAKGAVRCAILKCLTIWDDVDVIAQCSRESVVDHLESIGAKFTLNHYGDPKIWLPEGQSVDVIPIGEEGCFIEKIETFFHDCDKIMWDCRTEQFMDPICVTIDLLENRMPSSKVSLVSLSEEDLSYYSLKTVYLAARHGFDLDSQFLRFVNAPRIFNSHHHRLCVAMVKELQSTTSSRKRANSLSNIDSNVISSAVSLFLDYDNI